MTAYPASCCCLVGRHGRIRLNARAQALAWLLFALLVGNLRAADGPPPQVHEYLPFFVGYATHAETIWREVGGAGYWGDGLASGNGGIRGTSNVTLAMAMLVHAYDEGRLSDSQRATLARTD